MRFSLDTVNCLGCCALGPVMVVDGQYYSNSSKEELEQLAATDSQSSGKEPGVPRLNSIADLERHRGELLAAHDADKPRVTICSGTGCHALRSDKVHEAFVDELTLGGLDGRVDLLRTGCHGFCERGTIVTVLPQEVTYLQVKPEDVAEIVARTVLQGEVVDRLLYRDGDGVGILREDDIPFYRHQTPFVFGLNRFIDPKDIDTYIVQGGYAALAKALDQMSPQQALDEVKAANLRGRGGGGFPAGAKWQTTRDAPGDVKYVVVNARTKAIRAPIWTEACSRAILTASSRGSSSAPTPSVPDTASSMCARSIPSPWKTCPSRSTRRMSTVCWGQAFWAQAWPSTSASIGVPVPS